MKLRVTILGCIKHAEIRIAPLTVFVGHINTNKTWTANSLYCLLRSITQSRHSSPLGRESGALLSIRDERLNENVSRECKNIVEIIKSSNDAADLNIEITRDRLFRGVEYPLHAQLSPRMVDRAIGCRLNEAPAIGAALEIDEEIIDRRFPRSENG